MSTFDWAPSFTTQLSKQYRVQEAKMGSSAFSLRAVDGINAQLGMWDVRFDGLEDGAAQAIVAFLEGAGGADSFDWTPPGGVDSKKYICGGYQLEFVAVDNYSLTALFEEVAGG